MWELCGTRDHSDSHTSTLVAAGTATASGKGGSGTRGRTSGASAPGIVVVQKFVNEAAILPATAAACVPVSVDIF